MSGTRIVDARFRGMICSCRGILERKKEVTPLQQQPYFCPNCRSNRVKFSLISSFSQNILKDAITGEVTQQSEPVPEQAVEATVRCGVCGFTGNEMRFIRQAEREPRTPVHVPSTYGP